MVGIRTATNILFYSFNIFQFLFFTFYLTFCSVLFPKMEILGKKRNEKNSKEICKKKQQPILQNLTNSLSTLILYVKHCRFSQKI